MPSSDARQQMRNQGLQPSPTAHTALGMFHAQVQHFALFPKVSDNYWNRDRTAHYLTTTADEEEEEDVGINATAKKRRLKSRRERPVDPVVKDEAQADFLHDKHSQHVGYDADGYDEDLMNQTDPLDTSLKDWIDSTPEADLPTYKSAEDIAMEQAEKDIRRERREARRERIRQEVRAEMQADFERKLEEAKAAIVQKYEAVLDQYKSRINLKKKIELSSDEDLEDDNSWMYF